jgi:peptidyl-prolyl cis-trans isomerase A (cyclophilin A)
MAVIRRAAKQQRVTLMRVLLGVASIFLLTVLLWQFDDLPRRKDKTATAVTPEKLLAQQYVRKVGDNSVQSLQQQQEEVDKGSRRFAVKLANLNGGASGTVIIETKPSWAPLGASHFHELVNVNFYDTCRFFRTLKNFVVQFGIAGDPDLQKQWRKTVLTDDPVVHSNSRGTITYAHSGENSRATQLFINLKDNKNLDKERFAPFAVIVEGMEFVDEINFEYKEKPGQGKIQQEGNSYLLKEFPNLSYIESIREVKDDVLATA